MMLLFMKVALSSLLLLLLPPPPPLLPPHILRIAVFQHLGTGGLIARIYAAGGDNSVEVRGGGVCRTTVAMQV